MKDMLYSKLFLKPGDENKFAEERPWHPRLLRAYMKTTKEVLTDLREYRSNKDKERDFTRDLIGMLIGWNIAHLVRHGKKKHGIPAALVMTVFLNELTWWLAYADKAFDHVEKRIIERIDEHPLNKNPLDWAAADFQGIAGDEALDPEQVRNLVADMIRQDYGDEAAEAYLADKEAAEDLKEYDPRIEPPKTAVQVYSKLVFLLGEDRIHPDLSCAAIAALGGGMDNTTFTRWVGMALQEAEGRKDVLLEAPQVTSDDFWDAHRRLGEVEADKASFRPNEVPVTTISMDIRRNEKIAGAMVELVGEDMEETLNKVFGTALSEALDYDQVEERYKELAPQVVLHAFRNAQDLAETRSMNAKLVTHDFLRGADLAQAAEEEADAQAQREQASAHRDDELVGSGEPPAVIRVVENVNLPDPQPVASGLGYPEGLGYER